MEEFTIEFKRKHGIDNPLCNIRVLQKLGIVITDYTRRIMPYTYTNEEIPEGARLEGLKAMKEAIAEIMPHIDKQIEDIQASLRKIKIIPKEG